MTPPAFRIEDFDITADRGFLSPHDMGAVAMPDELSPIVEAGSLLPDWLLTGRVRSFLQQIPEVKIADMMPELLDEQRRVLMVHYSFIVQAYVWGHRTPSDRLPRNLAVPYVALAASLGLFPLLPYSSYTLDNWSKLDPAGEITLENTRVLQRFLGGLDEQWFILVHVEIEAKAGAALAAIPGVLAAVAREDAGEVTSRLGAIHDAWVRINEVFDRMVEGCDPYIYFHRVRPYIHGWKDNPALPGGVIYEGVDAFGEKPMGFRGQTGSQSSIVPTMDALLGIRHEVDPLRTFLDELHAYRPPAHRLFIEAVAQRSRLREWVISRGIPALRDAYNAIVVQVHAFRARHLEYAASYIHKQASGRDGNPVEIGTGGTPFMAYLKKHRDESERHLLREDTR